MNRGTVWLISSVEPLWKGRGRRNVIFGMQSVYNAHEPLNLRAPTIPTLSKSHISNIWNFKRKLINSTETFYPHIGRYVFYSDAKIYELLYLRAHKRFERSPGPVMTRLRRVYPTGDTSRSKLNKDNELWQRTTNARWLYTLKSLSVPCFDCK